MRRPLEALLFVFVLATFSPKAVAALLLGHQPAKSLFCAETERLYKRNRWGKFRCPSAEAKFFGFSVLQRPLLYFEYGDPKSDRLTLIQCNIHGDEVPAIAMCMNLISEIEMGKRKLPKGKRLIVQPVVNPDGLYIKKPTRYNARGVDINRNFPTSDWEEHALSSWITRDRKSKRKYPGPKANSEPETQAVVRFINNYKPQKIIAIHTPLGFLDLDSHGDQTQQRRAKYLAINMSKNSGNFRFIRFGFYPGSLGNFAGKENEIPVYTLELPSGVSKPTVDNYWERFRIALWRAIDFDLFTGTFVDD